jgi:hypothetical protein
LEGEPKENEAMPSGAETARRLIRGYDKGLYTRLEVLSQLIEAAATFSPAELAQDLSPEWLAQLREETAEPPGSPDNVIVISGSIFLAGSSPEEYYAEVRRAWYDGAWSWHRFLAEPDASRP